MTFKKTLFTQSIVVISWLLSMFKYRKLKKGLWFIRFQNENILGLMRYP